MAQLCVDEHHQPLRVVSLDFGPLLGKRSDDAILDAIRGDLDANSLSVGDDLIEPSCTLVKLRESKTGICWSKLNLILWRPQTFKFKGNLESYYVYIAGNKRMQVQRKITSVILKGFIVPF